MRRIIVLSLVVFGLFVMEQAASSATIVRTVPIRADDANMFGVNICGGNYGVTQADPSITVRADDSTPLGDHYPGWTLPGDGGAAVGVRIDAARFASDIDSPDFLKFQIKNTIGVSGVVRIVFKDTNGVWIGVSTFADSSTGWHEKDLSGASFHFSHRASDQKTLTNSANGDTTWTGTARKLVQQHSKITGLARVDVLAGCTGGTTYIDNIRIGNSERIVRFDLEGYTPRLVWSGYPGRQWRQGITSYRKTNSSHTEYVWLSAFNTDPNSPNPDADVSLKVPVTIEQFSAGQWRVIDRDRALDANGYRRIQLGQKNARYRFSTPATGLVDGSYSSELRIYAPYSVRASSPSTVKNRGRVVVTGVAQPYSGRTRVLLQRCYTRCGSTSARWSNVASAYSSTSGRFTLAKRAPKSKRATTWYLRVLVPSTAYNYQAFTRLNVRVLAPKKPTTRKTTGSSNVSTVSYPSSACTQLVCNN